MCTIFIINHHFWLIFFAKNISQKWWKKVSKSNQNELILLANQLDNLPKIKTSSLMQNFNLLTVNLQLLSNSPVASSNWNTSSLHTTIHHYCLWTNFDFNINSIFWNKTIEIIISKCDLNNVNLRSSLQTACNFHCH